jgi:ABC-type polysaccharide/polyol phosphate export permease
MVPARLVFVIYLNPFSYFVLALHELVFGRFPRMAILAACLILGLGSLCLGFSTFRRIKQVFLDYV